MVATTQPAWVDAEKDYKLAIVGGRLRAMNPKGKPLSAVPKWLKESEVAESLRALANWLGEHRLECERTVERWMMRSLAVPRAVAAEVWDDPDWRDVLRNLVVVPADAKGRFDPERTGILREVDAAAGLGVVDLDGESVWIKTAAFGIPHPILIGDRDELRELAGDLGLEQTLPQLYRPVFKPAEDRRDATSVNDYRDGRFAEVAHVTGLCRRLGYPVRGGSATARLWEDGRVIEARFYLGADYPEGETWTGELTFVDESQQPVPLGDLGAVTYSEGVRMAEAVYAKRVVDENENEEE